VPLAVTATSETKLDIDPASTTYGTHSHELDTDRLYIDEAPAFARTEEGKVQLKHGDTRGTLLLIYPDGETWEFTGTAV
jgi:hypothetical protein